MAIVLERLKGQESISEICRDHQISQTLFCRCQDHFLEDGQKKLANGARTMIRKLCKRRLRSCKRSSAGRRSRSRRLKNMELISGKRES